VIVWSRHSESNRALSRTRRACRKPRAPWRQTWRGRELNSRGSACKAVLRPDGLPGKHRKLSAASTVA